MQILIIGAGRSASALIDYLLSHSTAENGWRVVVADISLAAAQQKVNNHPSGEAVAIDINDAASRAAHIAAADIVASMLPPALHDLVAIDCLQHKKHLVTASYLSEKLLALHPKVAEAGLLFMGEMGLDPGIDHLSAMQVIQDVQARGGYIRSFKSYCGGLVAPECEGGNPWGYKFSWNPMNVVKAGQGTAQYMDAGKRKYLPYQRVFADASRVSVQGLGEWDAYANRDSLGYRKIYGLEDAQTLIRGTLRKRGYCKTWDVFVQLGMTDDTYKIDPKDWTYSDFLEAFLPAADGDLRARLMQYLNKNAASNCIKKIEWLGFFDNKPIGIDAPSSPAAILLSLLLEKWKLETTDRDMVIMQHEFEYRIDNQDYTHTCTLVTKGDNQEDTAMAKLVGLPMAILIRLIIENKIALRGVHIPVQKEVYEQVLPELERLGVRFVETIEKV